MARKETHIFIEGLDRIIGLINGLAVESVSGDLLDEIGFYLTQAILKRTALGLGSDGKLFEPYSPKYRLFRLKKGHPVNVVSLFFSGSMLSALTHEVFNDRVELYFMPTYGRAPSGGTSKVSNPEKAFFLNERRNFFAVSEEERAIVNGMVQMHLFRLMRRGE